MAFLSGTSVTSLPRSRLTADALYPRRHRRTGASHCVSGDEFWDIIPRVRGLRWPKTAEIAIFISTENIQLYANQRTAPTRTREPTQLTRARTKSHDGIYPVNLKSLCKKVRPPRIELTRSLRSLAAHFGSWSISHYSLRSQEKSALPELNSPRQSGPAARFARRSGL